MVRGASGAVLLPAALGSRLERHQRCLEGKGASQTCCVSAGENTWSVMGAKHSFLKRCRGIFIAEWQPQEKTSDAEDRCNALEKDEFGGVENEARHILIKSKSIILNRENY